MINKTILTYLLFFAIFSYQINAQTNLALGKPITYSTGTGTGATIVDGDFATSFQTGTTQSHPNAEWIQIDLGADYLIENLVLGGLSSGTNDRRFMIVTWPSTVPFTPTAQPDTAGYLNNSLLNRLIYTDAAAINGSNVFGETAGNPNTPGNAAQNLGPVYPTEVIGGSSRPVLRLNVGIHEARYIRIINLQDTALGFSEIQLYKTNTSPVRVFRNGGFEQGGTTAQGVVREALVNGWSTTDPVGMFDQDPTIPANGSYIEFWRTGFGGVNSAEGNYFVELNANANGMLVQEPMCVLPNETFSWSFAHRGRLGVDRMALVINDKNVAQFDDSNTVAGTHQVVPGTVDAASTTASIVSTNANGWTYYQGTWKNNSAVSDIVNFGFSAISSSGGTISVGNFLDDVKIATTNTVAGFSNPAFQGLENIPTANLPVIILSGVISTATTIDLNILGGTAVRGADYTTTPTSGIITIPVPAGSYDGTAATGISLAPYIQIVNDVVTPEVDETIIIQLQNPGGNILLPGVSYCEPFYTPVTYTIKDFPRCYKPAATVGTPLQTDHGITSLGRAGANNGNWPMVRNGAWTVLEAKTKGFVINRIPTTAEVVSISNPVIGMMVYDAEADCLKINTDGTPAGWKCFNTQTCP